jgi:N-acetylmuramoyl-L-alanine amidase
MMKITIKANHYIKEALDAPLPGGAIIVPRLLIIHGTNGATALSSVASMKSEGLAVQIVIDRDGTVYQCVAFNRRCPHAGVRSKWKDPKTGKTYTNGGVNGVSIGIELANAGDINSLRKKWSKLPPVFAKGLDGSKARNWEDYPEAQIDACFAVAKAIVKKYGVDVRRHFDVAPSHRDDPFPPFPFAKLRAFCGLA